MQMHKLNGQLNLNIYNMVKMTLIGHYLDKLNKFAGDYKYRSE